MTEPPELQIPVPGRFGETLRLDLGVRAERYAAEYDGADFHGPDREKHDARRRSWLTEDCGWTVDVFVRDDVFGPRQNAIERLRAGLGTAKVRRSAGSAS